MVTHRRRRAERGSTLVECAVATALLTTLVVGYGAQGASRDLTTRHSFERTMAEVVLNQAVEHDRATPLLPAPGSVEIPLQQSTGDLQQLRLTRRCEALEPGLWQLTYELRWTPRGALPDAGTRLATRRLRLAGELHR